MEKNGHYLTNAYIKIKNPHNNGFDGEKFECEPDNYDFVNQKKNYNYLKETFEQYGIKFNKIYAIKWQNGYDRIVNKYVFVVDTNSPIVWYRYESKSNGSGQNYIFLGKKRINTTQWISADVTTRNSWIDEMNQNINNNA